MMKTVLLALAGLAAVNAIVLKNSVSEEALQRLAAHRVTEEAAKLDGLELVNYLNSKQNFFKAELNGRFAQYPDKVKSRLMGVKNIAVPMKYKLEQVDTVRADIPDSFDSRTQWPQCADTIGKIRDQSSCGSCWAFGAAEAMTDRTCIASNGKTKIALSADDIMACCGWTCGDGCEGGYPIEAWQFWVHHGVVSGGSYTDKSGCLPYPFAPCEHHVNGSHYQPCPQDIYPTPKCNKACQSGYATPYNQDKHYGKTAYSVSSKVQAIQTEIMTNGPVEVAYEVYADFEHYTGGVYVHTGGALLGGHAVKMLGWGTDASGVPYWICANSWNSDWGESGFFRIVRGRDECGIESGVVAGLPKL